MTGHESRLAIIPARGGSKGIPRKNIVSLGGKPLVAHTIGAALSAGLFDRVLVSTDDPEVAAVSREYGAQVPFLRPPALSSDVAVISEVVAHTLAWLQMNDGYDPDLYMLLYPTSPFRKPDLIPLLVGQVQEGHGKAVTVKAVDGNGFFTMEDGRLTPLCDSARDNGLGYYRMYGLGEAISRRNSGPTYFHVVTDPVELVDIDTPEDLCLARNMVERGLAPCK